jgi:hypothetical protein
MQRNKLESATEKTYYRYKPNEGSENKESGSKCDTESSVRYKASKITRSRRRTRSPVEKTNHRSKKTGKQGTSHWYKHQERSESRKSDSDYDSNAGSLVRCKASEITRSRSRTRSPVEKTKHRSKKTGKQGTSHRYKH